MEVTTWQSVNPTSMPTTRLVISDKPSAKRSLMACGGYPPARHFLAEAPSYSGVTGPSRTNSNKEDPMHDVSRSGGGLCVCRIGLSCPNDIHGANPGQGFLHLMHLATYSTTRIPCSATPRPTLDSVRQRGRLATEYFFWDSRLLGRLYPVAGNEGASVQYHLPAVRE